ncbi:MAG: PTS sugar transporter subunit IIA [Mariprofundaceae bacterium]|nr:PTS sugar transporter subunit IIA [Mariprofundaceae bacterium]
MPSALIPPERIIACSVAGSKRAVLTELAALLHALDPDQVLESIMAREQLGSTGIGHGVAIPHSRLADLAAPILALARHPKGVDFEAIDGKPAHLIVMLLVPDDAASSHLELLARLARLLQEDEFRKQLMVCDDVMGLSEIFATKGFNT